jgi:hypothetical protein
MAFTSYAELATAIADWASRNDTKVTGNVSNFVALAEEKIWQRVRVSWGITRAVLTVPAAQNWVALPEDWLAFKRIRNTNPLMPRMDYAPMDYLEDLPSPGLPEVYSIEGGRFYWGQTPDVDQTFNIAYFAHPGALEEATTTWLLERAPSIYLYGALVELFMYAKNPAKAAEYGTLFDKAIDELDSADRAAMASGSQLRMRRNG